MNTTINRTTSADLPTGEILVGDAAERMRELPDGSIDCVITSPPYFRLRNYQSNGQIGLEDSVDQWVDALVAVCREIARVLKPSGVFWLNLGDTYSRAARHGAPPKSLVLAPEKLLLALAADGWSVRNKVVWAKPNGMPASVRDRLNCTWEPLYLLTRSRDYFFDLDAIRVPARSRLARPANIGATTKYGVKGGKRPVWSGPAAGINSGLEAMKASGVTSHPLGKNPGDVWSMPTASYRGAHFATFPKALVERPLRSTCPERTCQTCGTAWRRARVASDLGALAVRGALRKSCSCDDRRWKPGVVLDPFFGAGTVGVVAEKHARAWIGIELNETYATQARQRIADARGATS